ncbi:MAG: hypothetical protein SynsKO_03980 [Synoicihabitans sp.]
MAMIRPYFESSRAAGLSALDAFLPRAGKDYANERNYDWGPDKRTNVSGLSPWLRLRQITEEEVVRAVLDRHDARGASKFIDEVCWRTYWKGWLQLRPTIWSEYRQQVRELGELQKDSEALQNAMSGRTGLDCFDAWARELIETGYLHNHARMWVASIWIHTFKLPWELGADWFLRHLLDGDPASNTLSWRWVAGRHTAGKSYLATRSNIRRYTNDRFIVNVDLATHPIAVPACELPRIKPLASSDDWVDLREAAVLLTDDDLSAGEWIKSQIKVTSMAGLLPASGYADSGTLDRVVEFRRRAMKERTEHILESIELVREWLIANQTEALIVAEPPVGFAAELLPEIRQTCADLRVELRVIRRPWDDHFWPHATHGFFRFKKVIPAALAQWTKHEG